MVTLAGLQEKKKQREEGGAEDGNESDEGEGEVIARDAESFMQSIGWITPADSQAFASSTAAAPAATSAGTLGYDFNAVPSLPAGGHAEPKPSFSPHVDEVITRPCTKL